MFDLDHLALLTVIPTEDEFQPENISKFDIGHFRDDFINALADVGLSEMPIAAGIDFTHNTYTGKIRKQFFQPHWHCIIQADHREEIRNRIRSAYRNTELVDPAVQVKLITETPVWANRYCYKTDFFARTQKINPDRSRSPSTEDKIIPPHPEFEPLMLALHRIGLDRRILIQQKGQ